MTKDKARVALVTGGMGGLGTAICRALVSASVVPLAGMRFDASTR